MNDRVPSPSRSSDTQTLDHFESLCDRGLYLQALPRLEELDRIASVRAQLLAARARGHLGARRHADACMTATWRRHRDDPGAIIAFLRCQAYRRGPYRAWLLQNRMPIAEGADNQLHLAEWHSLRAYVLGCLRDFEQAQEAFKRAKTYVRHDPWTLVEWSYVCEMRDRYDEGIAAAKAALLIQPGYRAAIQSLANLKTLVGRDDEALELLGSALETSESANLATQLFELQIEKERYADAWRTLERVIELLPLREKGLNTWINVQRADLSLRLGRLEEARTYALGVETTYYQRLAEKLAQDQPATRRVLLPVGFVRQHHMTCSPATLTALAQYWSLPAEHLEIAQQICYDGTPYHNERIWAEEQGLIAREFTIDWNTARALLDAGIPFSLTTVHTGGGHLQAVIGYDELCQTLLIRDPFKRTYSEFDAEALFESHRSSGPRGMVLIPLAEAHRLDGIPLPEAERWDGYYQVMKSLNRHDRDAAVQAADAMAEAGSEARLAIAARRAIALYDGDEAAILEATERLLAQYPDDVNLQLSKGASLSVLASRSQQLEWLARITSGKIVDPVASLRYAQLLSDDGRELQAAWRRLDAALKCAPTDAGAWNTLAGFLWQTGRKNAAIDHYRIASCLADTNEDYAASYCRATHFVRRTQTGLAFLRQRAARLGAKSVAPAMTLFQQLDALGQTEEAFQALNEALRQHPDDPTLLVFAADTYLSFGQPAEAQRLLERSEGSAKRAVWLHSRAVLARDTGDGATAVALAKEAAELEPFALVRHRLVATLLGQLQGRKAALDYLRETAARFPHHCRLHELLVDWLSDEPPAESESVLRHLVRISPHNAWAQRELAINLARQQRLADAREAADEALRLAPEQSVTHSTLAFLCIREGNIPEARKHLRDALVLSIDNGYAVNTLVDLAGSLAERQEALAFIRQELVRQVTLGDGLLSFQSAAQMTLPPDELLAVLREANAERPDLWHSWAAVSSQLCDMGRQDEAEDFIAQAIERFPMLPRLYLEQARALVLTGQREACRQSLALALQISPDWYPAVRMYVNSVLDDGTGFERALAVVDTALRRNAEEGLLRAQRANVLERMGKAADALKEAESALKLDPEPRWLWDLLRQLGARTGEPEVADRVARLIVAHRPGDIRSWIKAAEYVRDEAFALQAANRAVELEPRRLSAIEALLGVLLRQRRFDELEAALADTPWEGLKPASVRVFEARLAHAQGDETAAIRKMRELLQEDPNHFGMWQELADWADQSDRHETYVEASENLVRLAPNYHIAHGYLAHALLKAKKDEAEAVRHLQQAMELDPTYTFAGYTLADLYLDRNQAEQAGKVVDKMGPHACGISLALRQVRLAALRKDIEAAAVAARQVFSAEGDTEWACKPVIDSLRQAGWEARLHSEVLACVAAGACAPTAIRAYLESADQSLSAGDFYRDLQLALRQDPGHLLKHEFLNHLGKNERGELLERFMRDYRAALSQDTGCWGMVSYAYLCCEKHEEVVAWMKDWRSRADAPAWALDNLAVALRSTGQIEAAREVTLHSLALVPHNPDAKTWLAIDAARHDRLDELEALLKEVEADQLRSYYQNIRAAAHSYLEAARAGDSRKALAGFAKLSAARKNSRALYIVMHALTKHLLKRYTPGWLRPWRWLQFALQ